MKIVSTIITSDGKKFTDMAKASNHEACLTHGKLINAWMDKHGVPTGRRGRRKSNLTLIARWEADKTSGLLKEIEDGLAKPEMVAEAAEAA